MEKKSFLSAAFVDSFTKHYADFKGEMPRKAFWMFYLYMVFLNIAAISLDALLGPGINILGIPIGYGWITMAVSILIILPGLSAAIRRLHDTGKSGWWIFIALVPLIGQIWLIVLLAKKGKNSADGIKWKTADTLAVAVTAVIMVCGLVFGSGFSSDYSSYDDTDLDYYDSEYGETEYLDVDMFWDAWLEAETEETEIMCLDKIYKYRDNISPDDLIELGQAYLLYPDHALKGIDCLNRAKMNFPEYADMIDAVLEEYFGN